MIKTLAQQEWLNRVTRLAEGLVRGNQMTKEQAAWDDQAHGEQGEGVGAVGATRPAG